MRHATLLCLALLTSHELVLAQGFPTSAVNWGLPSGGLLEGGITYGYNALGGTASYLQSNGSESWGLSDMNGDGKPDLVVTAQVNGNGDVQEFSPGSNSYWKVYLGDAPNGLVDRSALPAFDLFPVPATDEVHIRSASLLDAIAVYDAQGRCVLQRSNRSSAFVLNIGSLAPGMYVVRADQDGRTTARTLLVVPAP